MCGVTARSAFVSVPVRYGEKRDVEGLGAAQQIRCILRVHHLRFVFKPCGVNVLQHDAAGCLGAVYEHSALCAAAERLETDLAGARKQVEKHAALQIKLQNVEKRLFYAVRRGTHSIARERFQFSASAGTGYDSHSRTLLSLLEVRVRNLKNMYGHTSSYYLI